MAVMACLQASLLPCLWALGLLALTYGLLGSWLFLTVTDLKHVFLYLTYLPPPPLFFFFMYVT